MIEGHQKQAHVLETGKGLKKGPETFFEYFKNVSGPSPETRAEIKKNTTEITKEAEIVKTTRRLLRRRPFGIVVFVFLLAFP